MTIYKVACSNKKLERYYDSSEKALMYIMTLFLANNRTPAGIDIDKEWYNSNWHYDIHEIFNFDNWDKFKYILDGRTEAKIETIDVL